MARRLNTNDFATPVASIDAYNDKGNGVITIQSAGSYEYMAYQAENKLTISLKDQKINHRIKLSHKLILEIRFHWISKTSRFAVFCNY